MVIDSSDRRGKCDGMMDEGNIIGMDRNGNDGMIGAERQGRAWSNQRA
jgi:hypothetical protein